MDSQWSIVNGEWSNDGQSGRGERDLWIHNSYLTQKVDPASIYENKGFPNRVLALSKDEKYLVNASDSSSIEIINLSPPSKPLRVDGHTRFVNDIKFLPDNSGFITASADKTLRFTNQESGQSKKIVTLPYDLKSIDISPDGKQLAGVSYGGKLITIDLANYTYKEIWTDESTVKLSESPSQLKYLIAFFQWPGIQVARYWLLVLRQLTIREKY